MTVSTDGPAAWGIPDRFRRTMESSPGVRSLQTEVDAGPDAPEDSPGAGPQSQVT